MVMGGAGDDTINAGGGDDTLHGEGGADTFVFAASIDRDTVADYTVGTDALQIDTALWGGPLTQARLNALSDTSTGTLVLDFGGGDSITFEGLASNADLLSDITLV
jgi:Ca2+-binding RTX toxin-like protein